MYFHKNGIQLIICDQFPNLRPAKRPNNHIMDNQILFHPSSLSSNMSNLNTLSFWCLVMMVANKLEAVHKNIISGQKTSLLGPKRAILGNQGPWNSPPSGQTARYRKTEGIQSYLRIWGTYDPIESELSDPKKGGLYGCSVKKNRFCKYSQIWSFLGWHCGKNMHLCKKVQHI